MWGKQKTWPFFPIIELPKNHVVLDLTQGESAKLSAGTYAIGRYNEKRAGMYNTPLFKGERNIHMGIDISAPVGTPLFAFAEGKILSFAFNSAEGDYGATLVTEHENLLDTESQFLYALWGHLQMRSIENKKIGQAIKKGDVIAWIGDTFENGGWPPHVHFQLSRVKPEKCDMPGVVAEAEHAKALQLYPDPRLVLGPLY